MTKKAFALLAVICFVAAPACDRRDSDTKSGGAGVDTPILWLGGAGPGAGGGGGTPPPTSTILPNAVIPAGTPPAVGVTFELAFAEDVTLTDFALHGSAWTNTNSLLWQCTEGQTFIDTVNMTDNVNPTSFSNDLLGPYDAPGLDVVVWSPAYWNTTGALAYVVYGPAKGRNGRAMALQTISQQNVVLHEAFHFLYVLSWRYYQLTANEACLDDEYNFDPEDLECVMEITFGPPVRLCSDGTLPNRNHLKSTLSQPINTAQVIQTGPSTYVNGQPRSCWEQIIADYPGFSYQGNNSTTVATPTCNLNFNNMGIN